MAKVQTHIIKIKDKKSGLILYTRKNKKQNPDKLSLKKYNKVTRKHELFTEAKK
ncbi:MAG: 50S ribosomal protein L33 [Alphaproteobacteria bacterium]|nr:50S ribosomal protein L33 [Alphaproteobacteria bacterium]